MNQASQDEQREFEEQVRAIARALWPTASFGGTENIGRVEYDGVFFAFDTIHCVEATVSRRQDKAQHDGEKLKKAIDRWTGRDDRLAKGWFITKDEPTPQQTEAIKRIDRRITAISFRRFKARLADVYRYSQLREAMRFGSAVNPDPDDPNQEPYVPVTFTCLDGDGNTWEATFDKSLGYASEGRRLAIIGDYGIGKSMNLREIFFKLTIEAKANRALNMPIHINLRDHWGQRSPSAAITQHAEEIGYENSSQLVAAWRAGFVHVLLDGFDEIAAPGWSGDLDSLRSSRRRAVELVRRFVEDTPRGAAVIVAGRRSYFDTTDELRSALFGYNPNNLLLELGEFNSEQIGLYLKTRHIRAIPDWLPARPLLLGHLAARKILQPDVIAQTEDMSQAESWDWLLGVISHREAGIEAGLSGETVREIIESLASQARKNATGLGPLTQRQITDTFLKIRGQEPSDSEQAILQRLPGLARDPNFEEGTRSFIDVDFANVAQARDVSSFAINPFSGLDERASNWSSSLGALGVEVAAHQCVTFSGESVNLTNAFRYARRKDLYVALADLTRLSISLGKPIDESVYIYNVSVPDLTLFDGMPSISSVTFDDCYFDNIDLSDIAGDSLLPRFTSCFVGSLLGRFGLADLPPGVFTGDCVIEEFPDSPDRNSAVMASGLPAGVRVTITILRKLYMQSGRGRLESALSRGMDQDERARVVGSLALLQRENMAHSTRIQSRKVWLPNRSRQGRALRFVEAPRGSGDLLYSEASEL